MLRFAVAVLIFGGSVWASDAKFSSLVEEEWQYRLQADPEMATHAGDYRYNDKLRDRSAAQHAREIEHARGMLKRFEAVDKASLS